MNAHKGSYYGLKWSSDWNTLSPWTLNNKPTKYIGYIKGDVGRFDVLTIGPLAIVIVRIE